MHSLAGIVTTSTDSVRMEPAFGVPILQANLCFPSPSIPVITPVDMNLGCTYPIFLTRSSSRLVCVWWQAPALYGRIIVFRVRELSEKCIVNLFNQIKFHLQPKKQDITNGSNKLLSHRIVIFSYSNEYYQRNVKESEIAYLWQAYADMLKTGQFRVHTVLDEFTKGSC